MTKKSILVVEDDVHFGNQIVDLLTFLGYQAELIADGKTAVDRFQGGSFDLVLSDLMLPEMNGVDVIKAIRQQTRGGDVPVLMMSAVYRNPKLFQRELRDLAIIEFLPKPFSIVDLGRRISAVLETNAEPIDDSAMTQSGSWSSIELRTSLGEVQPDFDTHGEFDRLKLISLFIEIFQQHPPGRLDLEMGRARRTVYFLNGYPVWGESNDPDESLAALLHKSREIDSTQIARFVNLAAQQGKPLREVLLAEGALSERRLFLAERKRVRQVVLGCFSAAKGTYTFTPGDTFVEKVGVFEVNPVRCLAEVVQRYMSANELAPEVYGTGSRHLVRGKRYRQLFPYLDLPRALEGLGRDLKTGSTVDDLYRKYREVQDDLLRLLWLMLRLGIAESRTTSAPEVLRVPHISSPGMPRPVRPERLSEPFSEPHGTDRPSQDILSDYLSLIKADCFAILGVDRTATVEDIGAAYQERMTRYALTRLPPTASTDVRQKAKELLMRALDAYETLSDPGSRATYELELDMGS